jgi:hypothetical protein
MKKVFGISPSCRTRERSATRLFGGLRITRVEMSSAEGNPRNLRHL